MKNIILVRHSTTAWNRIGRIQGRTNNDLDEGGMEDARLLAKALNPLGIQKIITSPLRRASQTAEIIARELNLSVLLEDERLLECSFGAFEGLQKQEIVSRFGSEVLKILGTDDSEYDLVEFGGECREDVLKRHISLLKELAMHPEERILLVGHGRGLNTLLGGLGQPTKLVRGEYRLVKI